MEALAPGQIVEATVTRLEQYGAWIDCGGRTGLIVIPEVSWAPIRHPADVLALGQNVTVKILHLGEGGRFSASLREVQPELNPWRDPSLFAVDSEFTGPVVRVMEHGCFVELRPDVWGLLRRDRWTRTYSVGERIAVRVEAVDVECRKIGVAEL